MVSNSENHIFTLETTKLAVIGLGYVGLPLAVEFGKYRSDEWVLIFKVSA